MNSAARFGKRECQEDLAVRSLHWLETHLATRQPLARLADFLGVSTATVHRRFREEFGASVREKIAELRCQEAERLLASGDVMIKEVAYHLGYRHPHDFSRAYRQHAGLRPTKQRSLAHSGSARLGVAAG
jgi:transcriptional regulator GlxA family with amidase domain